MADAGWAEYLSEFHSRRPGITEAVLARATAGSMTPYDWLAQSVPEQATVLDVGCGSTPLPAGSRRVGADPSFEELVLAIAGGRGPVVVAEGEALPFSSSSFDAVICSMALMVADSPARLLAEICRVSARDGVVAFTLPASGPLTVGDRFRYGSLLAVLGLSRIPFRNREAVERPEQLLAAAGYEVTGDERVRFEFQFCSRADADLFIRSLYLPRMPRWREAAARRLVRRWVGRAIGIPIRRLVVRRQPARSVSG